MLGKPLRDWGYLMTISIQLIVFYQHTSLINRETSLHCFICSLILLQNCREDVFIRCNITSDMFNISSIKPQNSMLSVIGGIIPLTYEIIVGRYSFTASRINISQKANCINITCFAKGSLRAVLFCLAGQVSHVSSKGGVEHNCLKRR